MKLWKLKAAKFTLLKKTVCQMTMRNSKCRTTCLFGSSLEPNVMFQPITLVLYVLFDQSRQTFSVKAPKNPGPSRSSDPVLAVQKSTLPRCSELIKLAG